MMWGNYGNYGMNGWAWGFGVLIIIGVVILVIVIIRMLSSRRAMSPLPSIPLLSTPPGASLKQILDERYARGELTIGEYRERLSALGLDT